MLLSSFLLLAHDGAVVPVVFVDVVGFVVANVGFVVIVLVVLLIFLFRRKFRSETSDNMAR